MNEAAFQELCDHVMANIQPTHPICYDSFNLCQLMSRSKLSNLAVKLLKEICGHYGIATEDITSRRKAPYIERLEGFLLQNIRNELIGGANIVNVEFVFLTKICIRASYDFWQRGGCKRKTTTKEMYTGCCSELSKFSFPDVM